MLSTCADSQVGQNRSLSSLWMRSSGLAQKATADLVGCVGAEWRTRQQHPEVMAFRAYLFGVPAVGLVSGPPEPLRQCSDDSAEARPRYLEHQPSQATTRPARRSGACKISTPGLQKVKSIGKCCIAIAETEHCRLGQSHMRWGGRGAVSVDLLASARLA